MARTKTASPEQLPVEATGYSFRYNIEHPFDGNQSLSIEVITATGKWEFEMVWFNDDTQDWDGKTATYSEVKAAGFQIPAELYS